MAGGHHSAARAHQYPKRGGSAAGSLEIKRIPSFHSTGRREQFARRKTRQHSAHLARASRRRARPASGRARRMPERDARKASAPGRARRCERALSQMIESNQS